MVPGLDSDRVYIVDTSTDPLKPKIHKIIEPDEVRAAGVSSLHTAHCLADGNIMISTMGDPEGNARGNFVVIDGKDFKVTGTYLTEEKALDFG